MTSGEGWREIVAGRVADLIHEANGGAWPQTPGEWERVARRFDVQLRFVSRDVLPDPLLRSGVLYVPDAWHHPARMQGYLAHEVAEACLQWEGEPPFRYHPPTPAWQERHRVAGMVERRQPKEPDAF